MKRRSLAVVAIAVALCAPASADHHAYKRRPDCTVQKRMTHVMRCPGSLIVSKPPPAQPTP